MKLQELFDKPQPFQVLNRGDEIEYVFTVGKDDRRIKYGVSFRYNGEPGHHDDIERHYRAYGGWALDFYQYTPHSSKSPITMSLTGTGHSVMVLSTVVAAVQDFLSQHTHDVVVFVANSEKKAKLYRKLISKLQKSMPLQTWFSGTSGMFRPEYHDRSESSNK